MKKVLTKKINFLELDNQIIKILENNNVIIINDLWLMNKSDLKNIGLDYDEINQIVIKLQLKGLDLNKKIYSNI